MWEQELERLRCRSLVRSPQPNAGSSSGTSDKVGELAERRVDLERRIELKREEIRAAPRRSCCVHLRYSRQPDPADSLLPLREPVRLDARRL